MGAGAGRDEKKRKAMASPSSSRRLAAMARIRRRATCGCRLRRVRRTESAKRPSSERLWSSARTRGARSVGTVTLPVVESEPGLFTADGSGMRQGAILNQDSTANSPANPAAAGSVVVLYGTGEGLTDPAGVDGRLAAEVLPRPRLPVSVRIGGREAAVVYAGAAPGLVAGVLQINVRVPPEVTPGSAVPVVVQVGANSSPSTVTLALRAAPP